MCIQKKFFPNQKAIDVKKVQLPKESTSSMNGLENGFRKGLNGEAVSMNFVFDKMKLELPGGIKILSDVSGSIIGGRMIAIMGPSGAGSKFYHTLVYYRNDLYERINGQSPANWWRSICQ